jgi:glutathione S-transferase
MVKVYGNPFSTCTRKVLVTLVETKTPYETFVVDFTKGEHKQEPHLSRQPFGQVPAIDDDGFALYESRAICRYLSEKADSSLIPKDRKLRALMEQWLSVETSNFTPHAMKFIFHHVFHRPQEPAVLESAQASLELCLGVLSKQLDHSAFLVGDTFTLADVSLMPYVAYLVDSPAVEILKKYPAVMSWWGRVSERPSWKIATGKN